MSNTEKQKKFVPFGQNPVRGPDPLLYQRIGRRIAEAREAASITQEELAYQIGESALTISRWENAARKPNVEDVVKLAEALNMDILFFIEENPQKDDSVSQLNRAVENLLEPDRLELLAIAKLKLQRKKEYLANQMRIIEERVESRLAELAHQYKASAQETLDDPLFDSGTNDGLDGDEEARW